MLVDLRDHHRQEALAASPEKFGSGIGLLLGLVQAADGSDLVDAGNLDFDGLGFSHG